MKSTLVALALMVSTLSQASTMKCYSLEEGFTPALEVNISNVIDSVDAWGQTFELRSATVLLKGKAGGTYDALGLAGDTSNLQLSSNGVEAGSIVTESYGVENRLSGTINFKGVKLEIGCEVAN